MGWSLFSWVVLQPKRQIPWTWTNTLDLVTTDGRERVYEIEQGGVLGDAENGHVSISWSFGLKKARKGGKEAVKSCKYNYMKGDYAGAFK